jgi:peroxiredoxin
VQDRIRELGATFVAITPQTAAKSRELIAARKLGFPLLTDFANEYAAKFNVLNQLPDRLIELYSGWGINLPESNGEPSWTLPIPGTYVVDTGGTIRYASAHPNYMMRPEPEDAVAALGVLRQN